jgi:hypothetical protein
MENNIVNWNAIPTVSSVDAYEDAVEAFKNGGSRSEYMTRLFRLGMPAEVIRFLADSPGRTMPVRER